MMRSMYAGVSGLRNHQIRMDVIGNNIANVNTVGFKAGRVNFQEIFNQTIRGASSPLGQRGGTNPQQVGLGMGLSSIDTLQIQGNLQTTGKMTDLAIQGNGFFVLNADGNLVYTRDGAFDLDANGYLINPSNGMKVQGWLANSAGVFPAKNPNTIKDLQVPVGQSVAASTTTAVAFAKNLDAGLTTTAPNNTYVTSIDVFDSLGARRSVTMTFTHTAANTWSWTATGDAVAAPVQTGNLTFNATGALTAGGAATMQVTGSAGATSPFTVNLNFNGLTQYAAGSSVAASGRDGYPMGSLMTFTIDSTGTVTGVYSNGVTQKIAQVAVATFANPGGLLKMGENLFQESNNSGLRDIGETGTGGRGTIAPGTLEMANVDLSLEFTNMISTQRGFQANSRIITTSDEMLQELVNLKR
ncbi:MAG TPA: flagellar hook protein FlgE [Bacillota bacterium]|jgi:flagellar hook protein FlgE